MSCDVMSALNVAETPNVTQNPMSIFSNLLWYRCLLIIRKIQLASHVKNSHHNSLGLFTDMQKDSDLSCSFCSFLFSSSASLAHRTQLYFCWVTSFADLFSCAGSSPTLFFTTLEAKKRKKRSLNPCGVLETWPLEEDGKILLLFWVSNNIGLKLTSAFDSVLLRLFSRSFTMSDSLDWALL